MSNFDWTNDLVKTIDSMDAKKFAEFISEDGEFRWANNPGIMGRAAIEGFVAGFFKSIKNIEHTVDGCFGDETIASFGQVKYTRHDGSTLQVPYCNIFKMDGNMIKHYWVHVDTSVLYK